MKRNRGPGIENDGTAIPRGNRVAPGTRQRSDPVTRRYGIAATSPFPKPDWSTFGALDADSEGPAVQLKGKGTGEQNAKGVQAIAAEGVRGVGGQLPYYDAIQNAFGAHLLTGVAAHTGSEARDASEAIGADAYTRGDQVAFARTPDLHTAAHEAAHVIQQRGGVSLHHGVGQDRDHYERHADRVADRVVMGQSAESLLHDLGGSGSTSTTGAVQMRPSTAAKATANKQSDVESDKPKVTHVPEGRNYQVTGSPDNPILYAKTAWLIQQGVPSGTVWMKADEYSGPFRELLDELLTIYPWANHDRIAQKFKHLKIQIHAPNWKNEELGIRLTHTAYNIIGLPPGAPIQVFPVPGGLDIIADTTVRYPSNASADPDGLIQSRARMIDELVKILVEESKAPITAAGMLALQKWLSDEFPKTATVWHGTLVQTDIARIFGDEAAQAYFASRKAPREGEGKVITLGGTEYVLPADISDDDRKMVERIIKEIFGGAGAGKSDKLFFFPHDIDAVRQLDNDEDRDKLLQILRNLQSGGGDAPTKDTHLKKRSMTRWLETARAILRRQRAGDRLGYEISPASTKPSRFVNRPVKGAIINESHLINVGMTGHFSFRVEHEMPIFDSPAISIRWFATRLPPSDDQDNDKRKRPEEGHGAKVKSIKKETTSYYEVLPDGRFNDRKFEVKFKEPGHYEIHADVHHDHYQPNYFYTQVDVQDENQRLRDWEFEAGDTFGEEKTREKYTFEGIANDTGGMKKASAYFSPFLAAQLFAKDLEYAKGTRAEGELSEELAKNPGVTTKAEAARLSKEIDKLIATKKYYNKNTQEARRIRKVLDKRISVLKKAFQRIENATRDNKSLPIEAQGYYASRTHGIQSGPLHLAAWFQRDEGDNTYRGNLNDNTELYENERYQFRASGQRYETMIEELFLELSRSYPDGSVSLALQKYVGITPTSQFIRFTRKTDTASRDLKNKLYSSNARLGVNILATILTLFPPTTLLGITLGFTYNFSAALSDFEDADRKGILRETHYYDLAMSAADLLPLAGRALRSVRISERTYKVYEGVQLAGDAWLVAEEAQHQINNLRGRAVSELAGLYEELERRKSINPADPRIFSLEANIRKKEAEVRDATETVLRALGEEGLIQTIAPAAIRRFGASVLTRPRTHDGAPGDGGGTNRKQDQDTAGTANRKTPGSGDPRRSDKTADRAGDKGDPGRDKTEGGGDIKGRAPIYEQHSVAGYVKSLSDGEALLRRLAAGDTAAVAELGIDLKGKSTEVEWGLGRQWDGKIVVVIGAHGDIDWSKFPGIQPLAHSHPASRENRLVGKDGSGESLLDDLINEHELRNDRVHLLPSPPDFAFLAARKIKGHRVVTPFRHRGGGRIGNPKLGDAAPVVEFVVLQSSYDGRWALNPDFAVYKAQLVAIAGGQPLGKPFTVYGLDAGKQQSAVRNKPIPLATNDRRGPPPPRTTTDAGRDSRITSPSKEPNTIAEPDGNRTQIPAEADPTTRRSLERENEAADVLAKAGYNVAQNPTVPGDKNPDLKIEGRIFDVYSPGYGTTAKNVFFAVKAKVLAGQASRIVINLGDSRLRRPRLETEFRNRRKEVPGLEEVLIIKQGKVFRIYP